MKKFNLSNGGVKMKFYILTLSIMITGLFGRATEPLTGWYYDQSTFQAFYMLSEITIDGDVAVGDGTSSPPNDGDCYAFNQDGDPSNDCDVVAAFVDRDGVDVCVGWVYADASDNVTTVPLMGWDGSTSAELYLQNGEAAFLRVYDASNGSTLGVTPGEELPGFSNNGIFVISGTSTANNILGCTDASACNHDAEATADDGSCLFNDCNGVCGGSAVVDDCDVCGGGNADMDCAGVCFGDAVDTWCDGSCGSSGPVDDACGVCDGDNSSCTGCTNSDADNYDPGNIIDDGSCEFTVPAAGGLIAESGPARVYLSWNPPADNFTNSSASYSYEIYQDGSYVKSSSQTTTQVTDLEGDVEYCFTILAIHNEYGASDAQSNESCATPTAVVGPTWRLQLVATIDSYDQFENTGNLDWVMTDPSNYLGAAADADWGYDFIHDIPEPPFPPTNYISLYFDHPEWDADGWGAHFTEDIVRDDDEFFSTNLTQWDGTVVSNVPGSASITFSIETGQISYPMYVQMHDENGDGVYYPISNEGETTVEFYMGGSGHQNFSVFIGDIAPQAPDNLSATGNYNSITLDWDEDDSDLSDIGNRYPATSYNVYRDDAPADPDSNDGNPGDGPGGCGGLLTGSNGQTNSDYHDDADLYADYPGEGLLQESTYSYTVTGSNAAGESSEGHTVRRSGGGDTWYAGRQSQASATTGDNADPIVSLSHVLSIDGTNLADGHYEIPHNFDPDENRITISNDGSASGDADYPYGIDRYSWTQTAGNDDLQDITGTNGDFLTFTVGNPHENGAKSYTWNLHVETDHPVKASGECGVWTSVLHTHEDEDEISVTIEEEPNADPVASSALGLIRSADGISVITMNDFDDSDFNDYDATDQAWYEPHDGSGDQNDADAWFSASDSDDADGECTMDGEEGCDHQNYTWSLTRGVLAGFSYDDLNGNGLYDFGEPYTLQNGDEIYEDVDLGDYDASGPASELLSGACGDCAGDVYTNGSHIDQNGSYGYNGNVALLPAEERGGRDLHLSLSSEDSSGDDGEDADPSQEVYILSMRVTDVYGDSDDVSLLVLVKDERNQAPTVGSHRSQPVYFMRTDENTRDTYIDECDNLSAADADNDSQSFSWEYDGPGAYDADGNSLNLNDFASSYTHDYDADVSGWNDMEAWLVEGEHTFTFTTVDGYDASASSSTTFQIADEPGAAAPSIWIDHTGLKYSIISVQANALTDDMFPDDECHGDTYAGTYPDYNTSAITLYRDGEAIMSWDDDTNVSMDVQTHIDETLPAATDFIYTAKAWNSELINQSTAVKDSSTTTTTHRRPDVAVLTPNGAEIRSVGDNYDVDFITYFDSNDNDAFDEGVDELTNGDYIAKIDVIYLADGAIEEPGVDNSGAPQSTSNGANSNGCSQAGANPGDDNCHNGDATLNYEISDNDGMEINYDAKVRIRITDVGDYNGNNQETHQDDSDFPFTMAAHTITKSYSAGWHLVGPPLTPWDDVLVDNFSGSLGQWGQEWVAYDVSGAYDTLKLSLGEGYYLALANDEILSQSGDPVIADPDCNDCVDNNFDLADLSLDKGWNLIANPLVNKVAKGTLTINDGSGDLLFEDAVDAGWIAPTVYGWFDDAQSGYYSPIDRLKPFGGYWVNTSRNLTIKVRPHLYEDGELTRKEEELALDIQLKARDISGEGNADMIMLGLSDNATDGFSYGEDEYDLPRQAYAAMGGEYIDLKIGSNLMKDIRSTEYTDFTVWNILVENEKVDNNIELSWGELSGYADDDIHLVINDNAINMSQVSSVEISSDIPELTVVVGDVNAFLNPLPEAFGLGAPYPNPFNPVTNLELALHTDGFVHMAVYNVRGQMVGELVNCDMKAGYHNVTWNADGVSSGMYFVKVEAGTNAAIQKLMLLK